MTPFVWDGSEDEEQEEWSNVDERNEKKIRGSYEWRDKINFQEMIETNEPRQVSCVFSYSLKLS